MPSNSTRHTIARQWQLLKLLPNQHPGTTSTHLHKALAEAGHSTSKRTIERDLNELSALFPLHCNDKGTPFGWYLAADINLHTLDHEVFEPQAPGTGAAQLQLHLWVNQALAMHLLENPLSVDMQLRRDEECGAHVCATVTDDWRLMGWLLAHAGALRLLAPHTLRTVMLERLQQGLALHAQ